MQEGDTSTRPLLDALPNVPNTSEPVALEQPPRANGPFELTPPSHDTPHPAAPQLADFDLDPGDRPMSPTPNRTETPVESPNDPLSTSTTIRIQALISITNRYLRNITIYIISDRMVHLPVRRLFRPFPPRI